MCPPLTDHANRAMAERGIAREWLERVLAGPILREADTLDPTVERLYSAISENEGHVLRVVVNTTVEPVRVVSVFFDRTKRGKL